MGTQIMEDTPKDTTKVERFQSAPSNIDSSTEQPQDSKADVVTKTEPTNASDTSLPLAPPPRPGQQVSNTPDYFSIPHPASSSAEQNVFEFSFGGGLSAGGGVQTPGGTKLPSVASLTSPSPLGGSGATPFWSSLRSGPLSPAMLTGPSNKDDYFSDTHHYPAFPTPNESSLRSGLTPGGSGTMFPQASPSIQTLFNHNPSEAATPGTIDFHRTALSAAAANSKRDSNHALPNITSQPKENNNGVSNHVMDTKPAGRGQFDQHDANDAANGLFLLANTARNDAPQGYAMAPQMPVHAHPQPVMQGQGQSAETSPHMNNRNGNGSIDSGRGASEMSGGFSDDSEQQTKPNTRGKGKKGTTNTNQTNGRRKAEDTPKGTPAKKAKGNNGTVSKMIMEPEPPSDEEPDMSKDEYNANGKKMTEEEKRKNFLERNRVAALKCRQRKKQWLQNLQSKVEMYSTENDSLSMQISQLREEVVNLKTLLLAHKDCPVSQQQGLSLAMQQIVEGYSQPMNPYNLAPSNMQHQVMAGQPIERRYQ
jgi:ATF/CREB family transcription factor